MQAATPEFTLVARLGVAAAIGLAVGLERERTGHTTGPDARFAGLRTLFLLGLLGGISGHLITVGWLALAVALVAAAGALSVVSYVVVTRRPGATADGTTEVSALVVIALGVLAGMGHTTIAAGAGALVVAALISKAQLHGVIQHLGEAELRGALQFAVLALVVLPLLPDRAYGPWGGVNPRALWTVVLVFAAVNYGGFVAHRWVGAARGYGVAGLLGGLVSSTAITLQFSRTSRTEPALGSSLGLGVVAACTVLLVRVAVVTTSLDPGTALALLKYLAAPFAVGVVAIGVVLWRGRVSDPLATSTSLGSPLRLGSALQMALAFQVALFAIRAASEWFGNAGVLVSAFVLGLTDMDALTFSMARMGRDERLHEMAAQAIAVGIVANTLLKLGLALGIGTAGLRKTAGVGLGALLIASLTSVLLLGR
ncbi:MAG: DUF4010 domain-containing protein [Gemmatimonadaceae bacterium]|nr:DUF4010 domain-containing protein [Gemmatimonadaceae bacterium]